MKIINRTNTELDLRGYQLDAQHIRVPRSEGYFLGKRFCGVLELGSFSPDELRSLHSLDRSFDEIRRAQGDLPPEALQIPGIKNMEDALSKMRRHLATLPSLELLEQFESETEDGLYLYPRAAPVLGVSP
jgi:hypothetical protein